MTRHEGEPLELGDGNGTGRRDGDLDRGEQPEQGGEDPKVKDFSCGRLMECDPEIRASLRNRDIGCNPTRRPGAQAECREGTFSQLRDYFKTL